MNANISYCSTSMAFSFILNGWKLLALLQSLGNEFQTIATLYAKQFCPCAGFSRGGILLSRL